MSTIQKFYLHDGTTSDTGTLPGSSSVNSSQPTHAALAGATTNRNMDGSAGGSQVSDAPGQDIVDAATYWYRRWVSAPIAAQTISSGIWTIGVAGTVTTGSDGVNPFWGVWIWRPSTGLKVFTIFDITVWGGSAIATTTETGNVATQSVVSGTTVSSGDIIVVELWCQDVTFGTTCVPAWFYDGTTDPLDNTTATSAASYVNAPAAITMLATTTSNPKAISVVNQAVSQSNNY